MPAKYAWKSDPSLSLLWETRKAFIAKCDVEVTKYASLLRGSVYFIFALDKYGRMADGVCRIAEGKWMSIHFWK